MKIKTKRGARRIRNQRVICKRFVVTDYTGCSYITAGKRYALTQPTYRGYDGVYINNDNGIPIYTIMVGSSHLNDVGTWYHPII